MDLRTAAAYLGCSYWTLRDLVVSGHIPAVRIPSPRGWRIPSDVLPLQWRHVDFEARVVRLDPHTTKNDEGRTFPFTDALQELLEAQKAEHDRLKAEEVLCPWVFHRTGKKVKGKRITRFTKAWRKACEKAGTPGRIPHDLRRTAVRNLVRAGIPERVAMQLTGHKTRSVFERYNIVSECDLVEAAKKLNAVDATVRLKGDTTYFTVRLKPDATEKSATFDRHGHNLGTVTRRSTSRRSMSL
jgi:excisionase family DNA binding protein